MPKGWFVGQSYQNYLYGEKYTEKWPEMWELYSKM